MSKLQTILDLIDFILKNTYHPLRKKTFYMYYKMYRMDVCPRNKTELLWIWILWIQCWIQFLKKFLSSHKHLTFQPVCVKSNWPVCRMLFVTGQCMFLMNSLKKNMLKSPYIPKIRDSEANNCHRYCVLCFKVLPFTSMIHHNLPTPFKTPF